MGKTVQQKLAIRFFIVFIVITLATILLANWLNTNKINYLVVVGANALLFILSVMSLQFFAKAIKNPNPNVFVRAVMGGTFVKLLVLVVALAVYLFAAGPGRSIYAVFVGMALYVVYTYIEVKGLLELNKQKDGSN